MKPQRHLAATYHGLLTTGNLRTQSSAPVVSVTVEWANNSLGKNCPVYTRCGVEAAIFIEDHGELCSVQVRPTMRAQTEKGLG